MNITRLKALIYKEILQILRDPSSILIAFILPMIFLFIFGYGVNLNSNNIKVGLNIQTSNQNINSLNSSLNSSKFLEIVKSTNLKQLKKNLINGYVKAIIIVPNNFNFVKFNANRLKIIIDGTNPILASSTKAYILGALNLWTYKELLKNTSHLPIKVDYRFWYNSELRSQNFLIPGSMAIVLTLIGCLLTALVIAREWELGTMEALIVTPIKVSEIILAKIIPYFGLGLIALLICTIVAITIYKIPFRGNFLVLILLSSVFMFAALGQGLLISAIMKNQFIASIAAILSAFLPSFMLSGFVFEINSMPWIIQKISYIFPAKYYISGLKTVFLTGDVWYILIDSILAMSLIGTCFFILISLKVKKRID